MARKTNDEPLQGLALIKEVSRRIRVARSYWDAHNNAACRLERERAMELYDTLSRTREGKDSPGAARMAPLPEREVLRRRQDQAGRRQAGREIIAAACLAGPFHATT